MNLLDTQLESWAMLKPHLTERCHEVLRYYIDVGEATAWEISKRTGVPINCITGRTKDLRDRNLLIDTGKRRVNPDSGKKNAVYRPNPTGYRPVAKKTGMSRNDLLKYIEHLEERVSRCRCVKQEQLSLGV